MLTLKIETSIEEKNDTLRIKKYKEEDQGKQVLVHVLRITSTEEYNYRPRILRNPSNDEYIKY